MLIQYITKKIIIKNTEKLNRTKFISHMQNTENIKVENNSCNLDILTTLIYSMDNGLPQSYFMRAPKEDEKSIAEYFSKTTKGDCVPTLVRDAREKGCKQDVHSFELVDQKTTLSTEDFYKDHGKILDVYYKEIEETMKKATGAAYVKVFHHQIRSQQKKDSSHIKGSNVQPYAVGIHSDSGPNHAEKMFQDSQQSASEACGKDCSKGRFSFINAWRNITDTPIVDHPQALCDENSLVKPDDLLEKNNK